LSAGKRYREPRAPIHDRCTARDGRDRLGTRLHLAPRACVARDRERDHRAPPRLPGAVLRRHCLPARPESTAAPQYSVAAPDTCTEVRTCSRSTASPTGPSRSTIWRRASASTATCSVLNIAAGWATPTWRAPTCAPTIT